MTTPSAKRFLCVLDGIPHHLCDVIAATGLTRMDILQAFARQPDLATAAAVKANVVAFKSRPIRHHPPVGSRRWNNGTMPRLTAKTRILNKTRATTRTPE